LPQLFPNIVNYSSNMIKKVTLLSLISALILVFGTGCASSQGQTGHQQQSGFNALGVVSYQQRAFAPPPVTSLHLKARDVANRSVYSGDRISFLWGLITIDDY
jgi:hypothetical protein